MLCAIIHHFQYMCRYVQLVWLHTQKKCRWYWINSARILRNETLARHGARERERVNDEKIATKKAHLPLVEQCSCYFDGYIYKNSLHTWQTSNACRQAHITGLLFGNVHTLVCRVSSNDWQESTKITVLPFYILLSSVFIAYSYSTSELLLLFFSLPFLPWHLTRVGLNGSRLNWKQRPNSKNNREVLSNENDTNICYFCSIFTTAFEEFLVDSTILSVYIFMYVCVRVFNIKPYVLT